MRTLWTTEQFLFRKFLSSQDVDNLQLIHFGSDFPCYVFLARSQNLKLIGILDHFLNRLRIFNKDCLLIAVLETRLEKLLARRASKLKKLLALLKSSLPSYLDGVRGQSIKLIMLHFRFRFPQGFAWVCID